MAKLIVTDAAFAAQADERVEGWEREDVAEEKELDQETGDEAELMD